ELEPHVRIYLLNEKAYPVGYDKQRSYEVCRETGVPVPNHLVLPMPADPAEVLRRFTLPVVVKARSSFRSENLGDRRRTHGPPAHAGGARARRTAPVAAYARWSRRRGAHRGVLRGRGRRHRHAVRRRRGAARVPAPSPARGPRVLLRTVPAERARASGHAGRCPPVRARTRLHRCSDDGVPPEPVDAPVAVPRLQRALLGRAAADGRLGSRLSPLALQGVGGGQAPLPAGLPLGHLVPELGARPDVGEGEPVVAATPGAHAVTRSRAGGVAVRHAARVERYPGAGRPHPWV